MCAILEADWPSDEALEVLEAMEAGARRSTGDLTWGKLAFLIADSPSQNPRPFVRRLQAFSS